MRFCRLLSPSLLGYYGECTYSKHSLPCFGHPIRDAFSSNVDDGVMTYPRCSFALFPLLRAGVAQTTWEADRWESNFGQAGLAR